LTTDHAKTHRHADKRTNRFLKHKPVKHFLSNLNSNAIETSDPDMTSRMTMISEE